MNETEIEQVIVNLVQNSIQAGASRIAVSSGVTSGRVQLTVKDDGSGIAASDRAHLFDPFYTSRPDTGTGLGLSITYGIVADHGGTIEVDTDVGRGTTLVVSLPRTAGDRGESSRS